MSMFDAPGLRQTVEDGSTNSTLSGGMLGSSTSNATTTLLGNGSTLGDGTLLSSLLNSSTPIGFVGNSAFFGAG
jgi:hypothetical protein